MRNRLAIAVIVAAALAAPAAAGAKAPASVHLKSCSTGTHARDRKATFKSWMHAVPGTARMAVRFTLVARRSGSGSQPVEAPSALTDWHRSHVDVTKYVYSQTVKHLARGSAYRMIVRFKWLDASGKAIKRAKRTSKECRQGALPNLVVPGVAIAPGATPQTRHYIVTVRNKGDVPAENFVVTLTVDGADVDERTVEVLEGRETTKVEFNGPPCAVRLRAVADSEDTVTESNEKDNALASDCPHEQVPSRR